MAILDRSLNDTTLLSKIYRGLSQAPLSSSSIPSSLSFSKAAWAIFWPIYVLRVAPYPTEVPSWGPRKSGHSESRGANDRRSLELVSVFGSEAGNQGG